MTSITLVNSLCGLLIFTSLLVIEVRRPRWSALLYSVQSLILVIIFLVLADAMRAEQLYIWAAGAFITKVVLVPLILYRAMSRVKEEEMPRNTMGLITAFIIASGAVIVSFLVVDQLKLVTALPFKPALAVSLAHFFFGELCILTQRNIFKQILGFCLMENGSALTLALLAHNAPELVEIGITTDAVFGVIIMVILGNQIYNKLGTLDTSKLNTLKG
jgi:hydrogenase-4 component E